MPRGGVAMTIRKAAGIGVLILLLAGFALGEEPEATVVVEGGSAASLVGPARVTVVETDPGFPRVQLAIGRITSFTVRGTITGVHTPQNAFAALAAGTIGAGAAADLIPPPGDGSPIRVK